MTQPSATALRPSRRPTASGKPRRHRSVAGEHVEDLTVVLVGIYIRVSTAREEMISPELQLRDANGFLARMTAQTGTEWRAVVIEEDLEVSGRSFAREGIQRLMKLMRDGAITTIVTYCYDRFGRYLQQALTHVDEAIGQYMRSQSLSLAQLRSQQIGEGWKRLHIYRVDRGLPTNGRERYGYLAHRTTHIRNDGALPLNLELDGVVDDPEQVAWVDPSHEGS